MEQNPDTETSMTPVVEKGQKNGNWLKIATAIACVVAVCGIGFGVYGMMQSSQKDSQISELKTRIDSAEKEKNEEPSDPENENPQTLPPTDSVSFEDYSNSLISKIKSLGDTVQSYKQETKILDWSEKQFRAKIDKDANLVLIWNNYKNEKVLASDVIDFEFVVFGNGGGDTYLYYINKDGSVSKTENLQNVDDREPAITNNISGFKEIISIQTTHGNYPYGPDGFYACFTNFNGDILFE